MISIPEVEISQFPDKLVFSDAGHANNSMLVRLESDFRFKSSKGIITVPKNFISDGASIPRVFWSILGPFGEYYKAALIHDYLYSSLNTVYTRAEADDIFDEGMYNLEVPFIKRFLIYGTVRTFGWMFYKGFKG